MVDAGVVDEHVDRSALGLDARQQPVDGGAVREVARERARPLVAGGPDRRVERTRITRDERHTRVPVEEDTGERVPDPSARAGHDDVRVA